MHANSSGVIQGKRFWGWAARPSVRVGRSSVDVDSRPARVDDVVVAVCFLALVGLVVFGGLLMLFSWVTAGLPPSAVMTCPESESCAPPAPVEDSDPAPVVYDRWADEPFPIP